MCERMRNFPGENIAIVWHFHHPHFASARPAMPSSLFSFLLPHLVHFFFLPPPSRKSLSHEFFSLVRSICFFLLCEISQAYNLVIKHIMAGGALRRGKISITTSFNEKSSRWEDSLFYWKALDEVCEKKVTIICFISHSITNLVFFGVFKGNRDLLYFPMNRNIKLKSMRKNVLITLSASEGNIRRGLLMKWMEMSIFFVFFLGCRKVPKKHSHSTAVLNWGKLCRSCLAQINYWENSFLNYTCCCYKISFYLEIRKSCFFGIF